MLQDFSGDIAEHLQSLADDLDEAKRNGAVDGYRWIELEDSKTGRG